MSQSEFGNDPAKVERYRAFWERAEARRPLVGFSLKSWFPLEEFEASAAWQSQDTLTPEMVEPEAFMEDQVRLLREGESADDDILRGACPSQAVPWLCGMMGNRLKILPGSILAEERSLSWEELEKIHLDHAHPWFRKYMEFAETLVRTANNRFPVSHGTLIGPTDLAGALRGHSQSILDLTEKPKKSQELLTRLGAIFQEITEELWKRVPLFYGGYFDAQYQLWAPGPIIRMQEDATALYSPALYREFIQHIDRKLAERFSSGFIHLHSTSMFLLDAFLEIEDIRCFEVNRDVAGPPLEEMIPYFQTIQGANRSLLIRGSFNPDDVRLLLDALEPRGLYLYIMITDWAEVAALRPALGM